MSDIPERLRAIARLREAGADIECPEAEGVEWEAADEIDRLRAAMRVLHKAGEQFAFYGREHRKKGTPEADAKAAINEAWVQRCFAAYEATGGEVDG